MSEKIKNRHRLKGKDIRKIVSEVHNDFNSIILDSKNSFEIGEVEETRFIFVDGAPCFLFHNDKIVITLLGLNKFQPKNKFVVVDMGAVKFVTNGADVMTPGIVDADKEIVEKDQVWICDERNRKPLAVGIALMSGEQMVLENKGKAINIVHYVSDTIWNFVAKSL